jgi:DnaJ-domain-containing protein 1
MTRIGPPDSKLAVTKRVKLVFSEIEPDDTTRLLIEQADGSKGAGEIAEEVPGDTDAALRIIYGLRLLGVMDARQEEIKKEAASEPALTRDEVLGRLARAMGGDHYTVLGLDRTASRAQIRDAYYSLARRLHPDRFRTGDLQDLLARIEKFFKRVTEAYNTLYDPDLRREYNEMLESTFKKTEDTEKTDTRYLAKQNYLRGKELIEKRRFVDAVPFLENAVRMDDSQADYHYELGTLLVRNPRRKQDAEHHLFRTSQLDPSRWGVYLALGHLYRRAEKVQEAARMFREVLKWENGQPDAIRELKEMGLPVKVRGEEDAGFKPLFGN